MTTHYNEQIFNKFRELAITDATELVIGDTYYSNSYPEKFILKKIITEADMHRRDGHYKPCHDNEVPRRFVTENNKEYSLWDRNIGKSYNPWLIFKDEYTAKQCLKELEVEITSESGYDDYYV